ncbi:MAG: hypothetical protein IH959_05830 [Chloroflexi bacterium]|nr:hypothetical protein [Chloroflexota bacterium]
MVRWLILAAVVGLVWLVAGTAAPGSAEEQPYGDSVAAGDNSPALPGASAQDDGTIDDEDTRLSVQLWTVVAAAGAAGVGLLAFLLRAMLGWVKPPPPQEEPPH